MYCGTSSYTVTPALTTTTVSATTTAVCLADSAVKLELSNSKTTSLNTTADITGFCGAFDSVIAAAAATDATETGKSIAFAATGTTFTIAQKAGTGQSLLAIGNNGNFYPPISGALGRYVFSPNTPANIGVYAGNTIWAYTIGLDFSVNPVVCSIQTHTGGVPTGIPHAGVSICDVNGGIVSITAATDSGNGYVVVLDGVKNTGTRKITGTMSNFGSSVSTLIETGNKVVAAPFARHQ